MMATYALEFLRLDGRWHQPTFYTLPEDATPADELTNLLVTMRDEIGARVAPMSPGRYAVHLKEAQQCWSVRIVEVGMGNEDTAEIVVGANDFGTEVYSK